MIRLISGRAAAAVIAGTVATHGHTAVSVDAYKDLAKSEALALYPYKDVAGVLTVCYGETKNVEMRWYTPEECSKFLVARVEGYYAPGVQGCTKPAIWNGLGQPTRDAIVEFAYNVGIGAYCTSSVRKRLDAGMGIRSCDRMLLFNKSRVKVKLPGGVFTTRLQAVPGLTKRRMREAEKCKAGFRRIV